jgi:hypothetical protein
MKLLTVKGHGQMTARIGNLFVAALAGALAMMGRLPTGGVKS